MKQQRLSGFCLLAVLALILGMAPVHSRMAQAREGTAAGAAAFEPPQLEPLIQDVSDSTRSIDAVEADTLEVIGHVGGDSEAVAVQDGYAYVGFGQSMMIVDMSDPANPEPVATQPIPYPVYDIEVLGDAAYIAADELYIIDISNPEDPRILGSLDTSGGSLGVYVDGDYAYLAQDSTYAGYLRVVDISEPTAPTLVGSTTVGENATDVHVVGDVAYVVDTNGLKVIDVSDRQNPVQITSMSFGDGAVDVYVVGTYAYLSAYGYLRILDISDPANPFQVGSCAGASRGLDVNGSYVYAANYYSGLRVIDVSEPTAPTVVGTYDTPGMAYGVAVTGDYAYVADLREGLRIVDVSIPSSPSEVAHLDTWSFQSDVFVTGDHAYVASSYEGLQIVDLSDLTLPRLVGEYDTSAYSSYEVFVAPPYAFMTDSDSLLRIIDVSDPANPWQVSSVSLPSRGYDISVANGYAYVAMRNEGLWIFDVRVPGDPILVSQDAPYPVYGVHLAGNYGYLAAGDAGLRVLDVSTPESPQEIGFYVTDGCHTVDVSGLYAYVGADYVTWIFDVAIPTQPELIGQLNCELGSVDGALAAGVSSPAYALRAYDVTNPSTPLLIGTLELTTFSGGGPVAHQGHIYVPRRGLLVVEPPRPEEPDIGFQPYPDGYSFSNSGLLMPPISRFTYDDVVRMLGQDCACYMVGEICFLKPQVDLWYAKVSMALTKGRCLGMAAGSLRFFTGMDTHEDTPTTYDLGMDDRVEHMLPNDSIWLTTALGHAYYHQALQFTRPAARTYDAALQTTPSMVLADLREYMAGPPEDFPILVIAQGPDEDSPAHALTPYAIFDAGNGAFWVYVYDPNYPSDASRHVEIYPDSETWLYDTGLGTWGGNQYTHSIGAVKVSIHDEPPICDLSYDFGTRALESEATGQVWLNGQGHLLISNAVGQSIGFVGEQYVNDLPGAFSLTPPADLVTGGEPIYFVPLTDTHTILVDGLTLTETAMVSVSRFGPGQAVLADDISLQPGTADLITVSSDGGHFSYQASTAKEADLGLIVEVDAVSYDFRAGGADMDANEEVSLFIATADGLLAFSNEYAGGGEYNVGLSRVNSSGEAIFSHATIGIQAKDTHYFDYGTWDGSGAITVYIDEDSNGSIDNTMELENEWHKLYLPLILRGG